MKVKAGFQSKSSANIQAGWAVAATPIEVFNTSHPLQYMPYLGLAAFCAPY